VAISENAGGSPASSIKTVTLPYTTPATVTVGTHSPGIAGIDPWVYDSAPKITLYDSYQYTGNVTTSGSTVTIVSGNNFDSTWTTGGSGRMRLSNVSAGDACSSTSATSHEETITGGFGQSVTLAAAPGSFTYYCAQDFSVMINRVIAQPSTSVYIQNVTVSYVSDDPGEWIDSGDPTIFAHNVINGGYLGEIPTGGGYAQLSWFSSTGYAQVIGPMQINAKLTGANTWSQQACPLMSPEIFIAIDDTQTTPTWYCKITDGAGKMAIVQVVYTGTCCTTSAAPNVFANSAAIGLGSPITTTDYAVTYSNATITDLTPSSLGLDLGTLITNYIGGPIDVPAAVPAPDCSGGPVQLGNLSVYCNLGQDYMGWMFAISPGNFNPVDAGTTGAHIIGSLNTWAASGASRFSGWHVVQDYGQNNAYFGYSPEPIGPNYVGPGATAVLVTSNTQVPFAGVSCAAWSNPLGITGNNCIEMVINPNVGSYEPYYWTSVLANGSTSAPYSETVSATGGTSPYTFALAAGTMPPSLLLNSSTGVISGTPSVAGTYTFSITATDSASHTGTQIFTINTGCCANPTFPTQQYSAGTLTVTATSALQGSTPGVPATAAPGDVVCISDSPTNCNSANLAQEYMMLLQKGVSGNNADWIFRRGEVTHILSSITSGTYTSCAGCSLANTGTCTLTMIGNGYDTGATAVATVPISIGAIAANAVLAFTNNGTGYASAPTSATISNGTGGVCSGTATVATTTTTPDTATKYLTFLPSSFSTQAGVPGWGGMYASYPTVYPSPIYGLNVLWNYSTDPNGVSTFIDQLSEGGHSFERPTQAVAASNQPYSPGASDYNVRYNAAGFVALLTTPIGIVSANPSFHGTAGAAQSNVYQAHPGMSGEDATPYSQQAAFDVRPLVGQATSAPGAGAYQPFTLVTGNIWVSTWTGASYTDVDDFGAVNRKIYATAANAGPHPLIDISGPGSNISTAALYTFCATRAAGECYAGSSVGQIYVNAPGIVYPWCYGNPTNGVSSPQVNDICVTNATPLGQAGVQFSTAGNDQLGSFQRVVTRVMNGATHETSGFANIHMLPDNSWALFQGNYNDGISRNDYMAQIPPFPPTNSIARSDFIPVPVTLNPPAGLAVNNAIVQFGYAEYGGNFTTRADACFANAVAIPNTNAPFLYSSETPAGLACSSGCTIMIPAISQRVLYYTVVYRNVSNGVIATLPTQVVVTP